MDSFTIGVGAVVLFALFMALKPRKKPAVALGDTIQSPDGPRVVGPHDLVIPAALLYQRGMAEFQKDIEKSMQRAARGGGQGGGRAPEEDETPPELPAH